MKRYTNSRIVSAESDDNQLDDLIDSLEDDFDYIIAGIERLGRSGSESSRNGLRVAKEVQSSFENIISTISEYM